MNLKLKALHCCSLASVFLISQLVMRISATGRNLEKEAEVAKSIVLYELVEPSDNMFERRMKSLVSNFLVNTAISLHQSQAQEEDYDELPSTTEKPEEKWPSYFGDKSTFSQVEGNKTTTTPPPSKKLFTWPSFFYSTSEIPSTEATTLSQPESGTNHSSQSESEIINPGQSQQFSTNGDLQIQLLPTGSLQVNQINPNPEYESLSNSPTHSTPDGGVDGNNPSNENNIPYQNQNNFQNSIASFQSGQNAHQQFQGQSLSQYNTQQSGNQWTQQNQNQLDSQQNSQTLNQYNQPWTNRFVSNNQFQMPNQNSFQNNGNNFFNPNGPQQQNSNVNQYLPNVNNGNAGPSQYRPNFVPSNQNPIMQQQQNFLPPQGNQLSSADNNVLVWPDSFMNPNYETATPALLPNVPGESINFFTTRPTTPPKKVFTWPSYFLKSTEPIPTQPWSLPEAPIYLTPSPDDIYSPPKRISAWSQFPSMPLTSPKPFRHDVNTLRTPPTTTKRSFNPFKIFTWPSFYFTSTSTVKPVPGFAPSPASNDNSTNTPLISNNSDNNDTLLRQEAPTVIPSPRPAPQKSAPEPPIKPISNEMTSPMTLLPVAYPIPTTQAMFQEQLKTESSTIVSTSANVSNVEANTTTTTAKPKTTQKPKPVRKPAGLIGAIQHFTLIVPDALRPGRNTTSILNKQSVNSILKIIGSVAFLNLSGVIDNSVALGTSDPVRELVSGVSGLVLCNPIVKQLTAGRCTRELKKGHVLEHVLNY